MGKIKAHPITLQGRNMVLDALKSERIIEQIFIASDVEVDSRIEEIIILAQNKSVPISNLSPRKFSLFDNRGASQGVAAIMSPAQTPTIEQIISSKDNPMFLLFNRLDYEQNLGSILRSSWAAGVDAVICSPNGIHELTPVVSKVSQGGAAHVPLIAKSLPQTLDILKRNAIPIVGVEADMGENYQETLLTGPVAFLFGGEADGISAPLLKYCDIFVNIPMEKGIASLNVAVSAALIMFEKRRQERTTQ